MKKQHMTIIGVVENSIYRSTFRLLKELFITSGYKIYYENSLGSMIIFNNGKDNAIIFDINPDLIGAIKDIGIDFDILIHTFLNPEDYENKNLIRLFNMSQYIIVNCDEDKWINLLNDNTKPIVITYGFNNKATINPSSYNIHDWIEANICFQREIKRIDGDIVEPFELPIEIHSREKLDIYSAISTITCGILLGIDILSINAFIRFDNKYII